VNVWRRKSSQTNISLLLSLLSKGAVGLSSSYPFGVVVELVDGEVGIDTCIVESDVDQWMRLS
jgi:hypothetical protein